jgi:hypothetical protein
MQTDNSDEQPAKAPASIHKSVGSYSNVTLERDRHKPKQLSQSFVTAEGMQMDESDEQLWKAEGMQIDESDEQ